MTCVLGRQSSKINESKRNAHLLRGLVLPHKLVRRLEPQSGNALDVIAPAQDRHLPELDVRPSREVVLAAPRKVAPPHLVAVSVPVELEEHVLAAEDEEIRVLGDNTVYDAVAFEVRELGVSFVRRDEVLGAIRG